MLENHHQETTTLPNDVISHISQFILPEDAPLFASICRSFAAVIHEEFQEKLRQEFQYECPQLAEDLKERLSDERGQLLTPPAIYLKLQIYWRNKRTRVFNLPPNYSFFLTHQSLNDIWMENFLRTHALSRLVFLAYLLKRSVIFGNIQLVQWVMSQLRSPESIKEILDTEEILNFAAGSGHLGLVKWLLAQSTSGGQPFYYLTQNTLIYAAGSGHLKLVAFLLSKTIRQENGERLYATPETLNLAARSGCLALVEFILTATITQKNEPLCATQETLNNAACSGCLDLVRFILSEAVTQKNGQRLCATQETLDHAARSGCLDLVKFMLTETVTQENEPLCATQETLDNAALSGYLDLVKFMLTETVTQENEPLCATQETLNNAAWSGCLDLVRFILSEAVIQKNGRRLCATQKTLDNAARSGNLGLVAFLLSEAIKQKNGQRLVAIQKTLENAKSSGVFDVFLFINRQIQQTTSEGKKQNSAPMVSSTAAFFTQLKPQEKKQSSGLAAGERSVWSGCCVS